MRDAGKTVLLTGASGGIGREMAWILAEKGYSLILVARRGDKMRKIMEAIKIKEKVNCEYFICDLSVESEVERLIETYPEVDILINNAGFANYGFFHKLDWSGSRDMIAVNVIAPSRLCNHYIKGMLRKNSGKILNIASTAGLASSPFNSMYVGTKAFMIQFSKSLAIEVQDSNVTVSCLLPGCTATDFWRVSGFLPKVKDSIKKYADPKDVAEFGIMLMEKGVVSGIPGWDNKIKSLVKYMMPEKIWSGLIRKHMIHELLYEKNKKQF